MARNRSKQGILADDCPERIDKWLKKLAKAEEYKNKLQGISEAPKIPNLGSPGDSVESRIEIIKDVITELKSEIRELEKKNNISRKQSDFFGGKGKRSKYQKLRGMK